MAEPTRSADRMVEILLSNRERLKSLVESAEPKKELKELAKEAKQQAQIPDTTVYKMMVGFLGGVAAVAVIGAIILVAITGEQTPEVLIAIGSAAVGAIAGALVPASKGQ